MRSSATCSVQTFECSTDSIGSVRRNDELLFGRGRHKHIGTELVFDMKAVVFFSEDKTSVAQHQMQASLTCLTQAFVGSIRNTNFGGNIQRLVSTARDIGI